jgi:hypothetical protein
MRLRCAPIGFLLFVAGCGGSKVSKQNAGSVVQNAPAFKTTRVVYLPRTIAIPANSIGNSLAARQGEALTLIEIASVDPVVAILRARDQVAIEDFVSAVPGSIVLPPPPDSGKADSTKGPNDSTKAKKDSTKGSQDSTKALRDTIRRQSLAIDQPHTSPPPVPPLAQEWVHTIRMTPRSKLQGSELAPDDGEDNPESPRVDYTTHPLDRTAGWTLAVGTRELIKVLDVVSYKPNAGDPPGEMQIDFLWRWKPTKRGELFSTESAEFQSLPLEVQQAALSGSVTIDATTHWSRATVARDGNAWKVTRMDWTYGNDKPHDGW